MKKVLLVLFILSIGLSIFFGIKFFQIKNETANSDTSILIDKIESLTDENKLLKKDRDKKVAELTIQINNLRNQLQQSEADNSKLTDDNNEYKNTNADLIARLNQLTEQYNAILAEYNNANKAVVTFMFDDVLYTTKVVTKGQVVTVDNPASTTYVIFNGWTLNGVDIVDLSSTVINDNTTFIASVSKKYDVKFYANNEEYHTYIADNNSTIQLPENPTKGDCTFTGWYVDNVLIDETFKITKHTEVVATFKEIAIDVAKYFTANDITLSKEPMNDLIGRFDKHIATMTITDDRITTTSTITNLSGNLKLFYVDEFVDSNNDGNADTFKTGVKQVSFENAKGTVIDSDWNISFDYTIEDGTITVTVFMISPAMTRSFVNELSILNSFGIVIDGLALNFKLNF